MIQSEKFKLILFFVYTIIFELMVWVGFYYIVFEKNGSVWWIIAAFYLSGSQLKPTHFGLDYKISEE